MDNEKTSIDLEQAKQMIAQDHQRRIKNCQEAIQAALQQYNCELVSVLQTNLGTLAVPIEIRAK